MIFNNVVFPHPFGPNIPSLSPVFIFKLRVTENLILEKQLALKEMDSNESNESIIKEIKELTKVRNIFAKELGIIVTQ